MQLVAAEYSKKLRRFVVFELEDGRRVPGSELARSMSTGKITVPASTRSRQSYIRADPDNVAANNLLRTFKANLTSEVALRNACGTVFTASVSQVRRPRSVGTAYCGGPLPSVTVTVPLVPVVST